MNEKPKALYKSLDIRTTTAGVHKFELPIDHDVDGIHIGGKEWHDLRTIVEKLDKGQALASKDRKTNVRAYWGFGLLTLLSVFSIIIMMAWTVHEVRKAKDGAITPLMAEALRSIVEGGSVIPPSFNIGDEVVKHSGKGGVVVSRHYVDHRWLYQVRDGEETHWMGHQGKLRLADETENPNKE